MIDIGFLSVIRRGALRDKMPIREIVRRTGLSRNTIEKYLREDAVEPKFKTPSSPSKLDPYADRLSVWLLAQTRKSRKERCNAKLMYEDLVKLGYGVDLSRFSAAPGARLSHLSFECDGAFPAQCWLAAARIIEAVDVFKYRHLGLPGVSQG